MLTPDKLHNMSIPRLFILPCVSALAVLASCSSESRDRLWRTLDPAGYKHAHSEVFNPKRYQDGKSTHLEPDVEDFTKESMR